MKPVNAVLHSDKFIGFQSLKIVIIERVLIIIIIRQKARRPLADSLNHRSPSSVIHLMYQTLQGMQIGSQRMYNHACGWLVHYNY